MFRLKSGPANPGFLHRRGTHKYHGAIPSTDTSEFQKLPQFTLHQRKRQHIFEGVYCIHIERDKVKQSSGRSQEDGNSKGPRCRMDRRGCFQYSGSRTSVFLRTKDGRSSNRTAKRSWNDSSAFSTYDPVTVAAYIVTFYHVLGWNNFIIVLWSARGKGHDTSHSNTPTQRITQISILCVKRWLHRSSGTSGTRIHVKFYGKVIDHKYPECVSYHRPQSNACARATDRITRIIGTHPLDRSIDHHCHSPTSLASDSYLYILLHIDIKLPFSQSHLIARRFQNDIQFLCALSPRGYHHFKAISFQCRVRNS